MGKGGRCLAYGLRFNPLDTQESMPDALVEILSQYRSGKRYSNRMKGKAVEPLLRSVRDQDVPYNLACPFYLQDDGTLSSERCLSGCVATCLEQILSYWHYPMALQDTLYGWSTEHYDIADVLPGAQIDWEQILPDYRQGYTSQQAEAIANLTYWLGMAAHMNWGLSSSGASIYRAVEPLQRVFGYRTVRYVQRAFYSNEAWNRMLRHELEQGRPLCYTGHNMALSGHAFNIDGVDAEGYYHLNWGYGGRYDGWYDLDYLNPFEPYSDATQLGRQEGFFCNQSALLLSPIEVEINDTDSLTEEIALHSVEIEHFALRRQPDVRGYVVADMTVYNTSATSLNFTFEVITNLPTDTALFQQADYVALSAVNLSPYERKTFPVYCQFSETGNRILAISCDDETFLYTQPVVVERSVASKLSWGQLACQQYINANGGLWAEFSINVENQAHEGVAGNLVTYCLRAENGSQDVRHWSVLSLPAMEQEIQTVRYDNLIEGQTYTLLVRQPWTVQASLTFTATAQEATDGVEIQVERDRKDDVLFDMQGRSVVRPVRGVYIKNGKKYVGLQSID